MRPAAFNQIELASRPEATPKSSALLHHHHRRPMGAQRPPRETHVSVLLLRAIGDLPSIIWEVLAAIIQEGWGSIANQLRLLIATYPLMVLFYFSTSGLDITTIISTGCVAYLYASFLYFFRLKDRLPWACLVATLIWFDGPDRHFMRRAAVAVFMLARDDDWNTLVWKRLRRQTLPWQDGSGFEFLYNFEGRELLREACLYLVNTLCASFARHRVPDDFTLRTSIRVMDVLVLPLIGLIDWAWRYRRAQKRARIAEPEGRNARSLSAEGC
ncbi:hypothetical protein CCHL11_05438 [Colletotrichum chlorophyti]|uniref:Uncharacterized protein n=1 Tax=Colletotrichum chlorophyti TaxID=708187 RepID=A0A1Q8RNQ0_9PEZI|nr:hypothetical protein CCHL11_05438 [Colletotrichum chlorophyti]